jgi:hypothetical protein
MTFASKRGVWVYLLDGIIIFGTIISWSNARSAGNNGYVGLLVALLVLGFLNWIIFGTYYTVTDTKLLIRCGPFFWDIKLENIRSVSKSISLWSSAALSLDRLKVKYNKNSTVYISPADRDQFCRVLKEKCPDIQIYLKN